MADPFASKRRGQGEYTQSAVITPADADVATNWRALYIGGTGHVRVTTVDGNDTLFSAVPAGTILPVAVKRVWTTTTTATLIVGMR